MATRSDTCPDVQCNAAPSADASVRLPTLKKRADFKRLSGAKTRQSTSAFTMQADAGRHGTVHVGYTVTRKVGGATERNRIKRRLRAAVNVAVSGANPPVDIVIVARRACLDRNFALLCADISQAYDKARQRLSHFAGQTAAPAAKTARI